MIGFQACCPGYLRRSSIRGATVGKHWDSVSWEFMSFGVQSGFRAVAWLFYLLPISMRRAVWKAGRHSGLSSIKSCFLCRQGVGSFACEVHFRFMPLRRCDRLTPASCSDFMTVQSSSESTRTMRLTDMLYVIAFCE